jgi:predicted DNA-binding protein (MmcQ/YjbR family)
MFASGGGIGNPSPAYAFKTSDMAFELLVEHGVARPAPYLARARWVQLLAADALPDRELDAYLAQAHALVAGGWWQRRPGRPWEY